MTNTYDVVVIGAGFAGMTAARELTQRGRSVTVLEARDRLGGRTWTDHRLGLDIELGGTWVHNLQPHVYAELTRYGLSTTPSPVPERFLVATGQGLAEVGREEGMQMLDAGLGHVAAGGRELMPFPYDALDNGPGEGQGVRDLDRCSVADRLATFDADAVTRAIIEGFVATGFQAPADEVSLAHVMRLAALCCWDTALDLEAASTFKIVGGTRALIEAIAGDASAEVRFGTTVRSVSSSEGVVAVRTAAGERYEARAVIVTVPLNVLSTIDFDPPLSDSQREVAEAGQASRGIKVWARVRGEVRPFVGFAPPTLSPLNIAQLEHHVGGDSLVVAFGSDHAAVAVDDRVAIETALRRWLPAADVLEVTGHDWTGDEFARQTWANLRPGQMTVGIPAFAHGHAAIHFAGSDYSGAWLGYIDGAIETGMRAARAILDSPSGRSRSVR